MTLWVNVYGQDLFPVTYLLQELVPLNWQFSNLEDPEQTNVELIEVEP